MAPYDRWSDELTLNVNSFVVVATRGHRFDDMALESAMVTRARYIGLLGSRRKTLMIYQRLTRQGLPVDRLKQVHAPIGLDIGALDSRRVGRQCHVGDNHGPAGWSWWPNADGRLVR